MIFRNNERGSSILEGVVSIIILTIILMPSIGVFLVYPMHQESARRSEALRLAVSAIESAAQGGSFEAPDSSPFRVNVSVRESPILREIRVTVTEDDGDSDLVSLETKRSPNLGRY